MSFWSDIQGALTEGLTGSSNPYLSAAGGLLGGGGGSGAPIVASPPPPPPPPPAVAGPGLLGGFAPGSMALGAIVVGGALLFLLLRK